MSCYLLYESSGPHKALIKLSGGSKFKFKSPWVKNIKEGDWRLARIVTAVDITNSFSNTSMREHQKGHYVKGESDDLLTLNILPKIAPHKYVLGLVAVMEIFSHCTAPASESHWYPSRTRTEKSANELTNDARTQEIQWFSTISSTSTEFSLELGK